MNPLYIFLKGVYFDAFEKGEKHFEFRLYGKRWNEKSCTPGRKVILGRGYSGRRLSGVILASKAINGDNIVPFVEIYGKGKKALAMLIKVDGVEK